MYDEEKMLEQGGIESTRHLCGSTVERVRSLPVGKSHLTTTGVWWGGSWHIRPAAEFGVPCVQVPHEQLQVEMLQM